jgi:hypothetical protein
MQEIISCPSCSRKLQVPESLMGQDVQCPTCGATFTANVGGAAAPSPGPAEPEKPRYDLEPGPEEPPRRRERRRYDDDYDDDYDDRPRRRSPRRDLMPHRGTTILVLGILGLVACPILGPFAWIMGNQDLAEIEAGRMDPEGQGTTQAGRICGMISTIIIILYVAFFCLIFFIAMAGTASAPRGRGF